MTSIRFATRATLLVGMLCVGLAASSARAGLLDGTPFAISGFTGSVAADRDLGFQSIFSDVDYAVFAPGSFQSFLNANNISFTDPTGGSDFIYAYQIFVESAAPGVFDFTVGIDPTAPRDVDPNSIPGTGDETPFFTIDSPQQQKWSFDGDLGTGESSQILYFSSPLGPKFNTMTINSGIASPDPSPLVPSPVPEPATLLLGVFGTLGWIWGQRHRSC